MWTRVARQEPDNTVGGVTFTVETDEAVLLGSMLRDALPDDIHTGMWGVVHRCFVFTVTDVDEAKQKMRAHSEELASLADQLEV